MRGPFTFALHQTGKREHDRYARDEDEERKKEIVEAKSLPWRMLQLDADETCNRTQWPLSAQGHVMQRPGESVSCHDEEHRKAAHGVDRCDALCRRIRRGGERRRGISVGDFPPSGQPGIGGPRRCGDRARVAAPACLVSIARQVHHLSPPPSADPPMSQTQGRVWNSCRAIWACRRRSRHQHTLPQQSTLINASWRSRFRKPRARTLLSDGRRAAMTALPLALTPPPGLLLTCCVDRLGGNRAPFIGDR